MAQQIPDSVEQWIKAEWTPLTMLYGSFTAWCERHGVTPRSKEKFSDWLAQQFRCADVDGELYFYGIALKP